MVKPFDIEKDSKVKSLAELSSLVFLYRKHASYWIFRGGIEKSISRLSDRKINLTPKVGRPEIQRHLNGRSRGNPPYDSAAERSLYRHFRDAAAAHVDASNFGPLELLSIAQHHGLPTRLLDWTESLFVAAYFAVARAHPAEDVPVIYATKIVKEVHGTKRPLSDLDNVMVYRPAHISPRITAQRGLFTVHKRPQIPFPLSDVVTITLSTALDTALTYKLNLHYAGINQATLFPDLDGIAEQLGFQYKWGQLPPNKRI